MARATRIPPAEALDGGGAPLRPTRAAPRRSLVPGPPAPPVAPAPRVIGPPLWGPRSSGEARRRAHDRAEHAWWIVRLPSSVAPCASLVGEGALDAAGVLEVRALSSSTPRWTHAHTAVGRIATPAAALGALGAALGALAFAGGEASLAPFGWLPAAVLGGAACAGALGAVALFLGAVFEVVRASRGEATRCWIVRASVDREDAVLRAVTRAGGEIVAVARGAR
jgi:hypothetical protein